jgi:hypothetical protein
LPQGKDVDRILSFSDNAFTTASLPTKTRTRKRSVAIEKMISQFGIEVRSIPNDVGRVTLRFIVDDGVRIDGIELTHDAGHLNEIFAKRK